MKNSQGNYSGEYLPFLIMALVLVALALAALVLLAASVGAFIRRKQAAQQEQLSTPAIEMPLPPTDET